MEKIKTVAILGAGALGSFFAAAFHDAVDCSVSVVARGRRCELLTRDGLVVNGKLHRVPVADPDQANLQADLIIVALKHHHLADAVQDLRNLVGSRTIILSVMNGLDSEEVIGSIYGEDKLLYAISVGVDAVRQGNTVSFQNPGKLIFGEAENIHLSQRVRRVQVALDRAGIIHETPADMIRTMWWKFMVNVRMNQASAVMRAPYGLFQSAPEAQAVMEALMREVIALAAASGVNLGQQDLDDWYTILKDLSPQGRTSMLQDIEAGRKTEVEIFAGKVVELGHNLGIPTPLNQTMLHIIHVLEQHKAQASVH